MGTELGMPDFSDFTLAELLPTWLHGSCGEELEAYIEDIDEAALPAHIGHFMASACSTSGSMHILHNLSKDIDAQLMLWENFHDGLQRHMPSLVSPRSS